MASELLLKQFRFSRAVVRLIDYAHSLGYEVTIGEVYRSDEQAEIHAMGFQGREALASLVDRAFPLLAKKIRNNRGNGIRNSVHCSRLAIDLQLFNQQGQWLQEPYPYSLLADFWEALDKDHCAGIRWGDTPHFSIEWQGAR